MTASTTTPTVRALVIDLWRTLVPLPDQVRKYAFNEAAYALGEEPHMLAPLWRATRTQRETRPLSTYLDELRRSSGKLWTDAMLADLMTARARIHGAMFDQPCQGAIRLLSTARTRNLPVAVVSNGTSDVRAMFEASPLAKFVDALILSAEVGICKPNATIFRRAATALRVPTQACLYVGDGNDDELQGAAAVGMTAVLIDIGVQRSWGGRRTTQLDTVLTTAGLI